MCGVRCDWLLVATDVDAADAVWATALVLAYLRSTLMTQQAEWMLLERKALRWLARSVTPAMVGTAVSDVAEAVVAAAVAALAGL